MRTILAVLLLLPAAPVHNQPAPKNQPATSQPAQQGSQPSSVIAQTGCGNPTPTIKVAEMPPKDSLDRWSFGATMALAVVGILGVVVGVFTLRYLGKQVHEMKKQREAMKTQADVMAQQLAEMKVASDLARQSSDAARMTAKASAVSAAAAEKSAEAALTQTKAMKDRERARLTIQPMEKPEIDLPVKIMNGLCPLEATLSVSNAGLTKAFNVRAYAVITVVTEKDGGPFGIGFQQELPSTISNTDGGQLPKIRVTGYGLYGRVQYRSPILTDAETVTALCEGRKFLQLSGLLTYTDIFEDRHEVPFKYIWMSQGDDDGKQWRTMSSWYDLGVTDEEVDADRQLDVAELEEKERAEKAGS